MSLISCSLQLENSLPFYRPGEVTKGLVVFTVRGSCAIPIKGLSIQFDGFAFCKWEKHQKIKNKEREPKPNEYYVNREDYISTKNFLISSDDANPSSLLPGTYNYNFMVQMPVNAPSSFEGSLGSIRYVLQVYAYFDSDHSECLTSYEVKVQQLKDLRQCWGCVEQPPTEKDEIENRSCLKFWRHPLQLYISAPQTAYVAGECISLHIKICNYENLKIKDITCKLNRIIAYQGFRKEGRNNYKTTKETTTIACHVHSLFAQNSNVIQHLQQMDVPITSTSWDFNVCKCISLSYELEVTVSTQKHKRSIRAVLPIIVGSISLTSEVKFIENSKNHNDTSRVPSIAVARSMDDLNLPSQQNVLLEEQNQMAAQQMQLSSVSLMSLASSLREADYMSPVKLNKKSKCKSTGDPIDFKPKYLYFDLPAELQTSLHDDRPSCTSPLQEHSTYLVGENYNVKKM